MERAERLDPGQLFEAEVVDGSGHRLGRVSALVHRGDGCDVLIERRSWLRHRVVRVDLDDLVETGGGRRYQFVPTGSRSTGPCDGRVA